MISENMKKLVQNNSVIRQMFEEGKKLSEKYGKENVYDFSLGDPSIEPPSIVNDAIKDSLNIKNIHAYMNNSGYEEVRTTIANYINDTFGTQFNTKNVIMSVGAAGGLNVILKTILNKGDEVIVFIPYFMEYRNYIQNFDGKIVEVNCYDNFEPNIDDLKGKITNKTKAVIINSPNNPSGIVYSENAIKNIAKILKEKENEFNNAIYLISDEPYREIVYDGVEVPFITKYYDNAIINYSYSKSLSIPGERIGYIIIPTEADDFLNLIEAASISTRILGFVNAPALLQIVAGKCVGQTADISEYDQNRNTLYNGLINCGYECTKPQGAFYLFLKSPIADEKTFCNIAKKYNILMVPGSSFAYPGYVRLAYCTKNQIIRDSIPKFKQLLDEVKNL